MENQYIPGACNIGPAEIRLRKMMGWAGLVVCLILWAILIAFQAPAIWRLTLFLPAVLSAAGFMQARQRFCAAYGLRGEFNMGPNSGRTAPVEQAEFRRQDRQLAARILAVSLLVGFFVAGATYVLPP
jgi:hypothetical protein